MLSLSPTETSSSDDFGDFIRTKLNVCERHHSDVNFDKSFSLHRFERHSFNRIKRDAK